MFKIIKQMVSKLQTCIHSFRESSMDEHISVSCSCTKDAKKKVQVSAWVKKQ